MYAPKDYDTAAEECVRLANQTTNAMVQVELLKVRQTYLRIGERLREVERGIILDS